jgi:hypothetical protein
MIALSPIVTPILMTAFGPMQTSLPIFVGTQSLGSSPSEIERFTVCWV